MLKLFKIFLKWQMGLFYWKNTSVWKLLKVLTFPYLLALQYCGDFHHDTWYQICREWRDTASDRSNEEGCSNWQTDTLVTMKNIHIYESRWHVLALWLLMRCWCISALWVFSPALSRALVLKCVSDIRKWARVSLWLVVYKFHFDSMNTFFITHVTFHDDPGLWWSIWFVY